MSKLSLAVVPQAMSMMNSMPEEQLAAMMAAQGMPAPSAEDLKAMKQQAASVSPEQLEMMAKLSTMGPAAMNSPEAMQQAAQVRLGV